ncbi:MAG: T9SS type A sorting domain-containing protein [Candidatus Delongbacteria bacterium]|nr:T9SS type A sorting domain-containing protein [Candidatus Delongbacteria bacterium]
MTFRRTLVARTLLSTLLALPLVTQAQLSGPETEAVYGGRINAIVCLPVSDTHTRVFIATESANSLFSADFHTDAVPDGDGTFTVLPDADADAGLGSGIRELAVDANTGLLFFLLQDQGIQRISTDEGSLSQVASGNFNCLLIHDSVLYSVSGGQLHASSIDEENGDLVALPWSPLSIGGMPGGIGRLAIGEWDGETHLLGFSNGAAQPLWVIDDALAEISGSSSFVAIPTTGLTTPQDWTAFGVAPDGRLFLGGRIGQEPNHHKAVAIYDPETENWNEIDTEIGGTSGSNLCFAGDAESYSVYFGTAWSNGMGETGSWTPMGGGGFETHPNDGAVATDPNDGAVVYMTTDQGLGRSLDQGFSLSEIDEGIEAVQVGDLEMDSGKDTAWLASKAGIRCVRNYQSSPEWSVAIFPNNDGSPYHSVAMDTTDHSGNTVFVGNSRVYRSTNGGTSWDMLLDASQAPWNLNFFCSVMALEVDPSNGQRVAAGWFSGNPGGKGLIAISEDGGDTFSVLDPSPIPSDGMDVNDLLFCQEDGQSVLYAGVDYRYSDSTATSNGVYRITGSTDEGWTAVKELNWAVSIKDLARDSEGGIYAVGADLSDHAVAYWRNPVSQEWETLTQSGFPSNGEASAVTVGDDGAGGEMPYVAVNTEILTLAEGASAWSSDYSYPNGTRIQVLYYDELLVGTGTGLYGHPPLTTQVNAPAERPSSLQVLGAWPNPFNPSTRIGFRLTHRVQARMEIFNLAGERVATLLDDTLEAGEHELDWNAGAEASGLYICRLSGGGQSSQFKLILLR